MIVSNLESSGRHAPICPEHTLCVNLPYLHWRHPKAKNAFLSVGCEQFPLKLFIAAQPTSSMVSCKGRFRLPKKPLSEKEFYTEQEIKELFNELQLLMEELSHA